MKETVSGCFFSEHSVHKRLINILTYLYRTNTTKMPCLSLSSSAYTTTSA